MAPQPKAEIIVQVASDGLLFIWVASNDAREWLEKHAPKYGNLYLPIVGHYDLFVSSNFDVEEVKCHIESMG